MFKGGTRAKQSGLCSWMFGNNLEEKGSYINVLSDFFKASFAFGNLNYRRTDEIPSLIPNFSNLCILVILAVESFA